MGALDELIGRAAWHDQARCAGQAGTFFSVLNRDVRRAKALCRLCPVRAECLAAALARDEPYGIWGGLTTNERREAIGQLG